VTGFEVTINVADLAASTRFYRALGFQIVEGSESPGAIVLEFQHFRIGLHEGHGAENGLTFRGGNVRRIADRARSQGLVFEREPATLADGSSTALLRDPDGNAVSFISGPNT
jgi:catechol 2,3-dioxygenase-like lactoylglutathione lyase family enzyme